MKLAEFGDLLPVPEEYRMMEIRDLTNDSREVKPGALFFAVPGYKTDGLKYLSDAIAKGAVAAVIEGPGPSESTIPLLQVADVRAIEGPVAARFFGNPSRKLRMIGVTGTNGKTTVTHLIQHILTAAELPTGLIGTVRVQHGSKIYPAERTTPDAIDLQRLLAEMVAGGMKAVVMEVSSHALALHRVNGTEYDVAVLTNITHDHFDFHQDSHSYLKAKSLLFRNLGQEGKAQKYAILNREDSNSEQFAQICTVPVYYYGMNHPAQVRLADVVRKGSRSQLTVELFGEKCRFPTALPGQFNQYNIMAAISVAYLEGVPLATIASAVPKFPGVPGRYQEISCGQPFRVMVDFAHNPAALENILQMAKEQSGGRRIIVFGCEGEKDRLKRPLMGKIAAENAEVPILTADNLYHEEIHQIFADVLRDLPESERQAIIVEPDRRAAIRKAVELARPGDFLIVAGKGHEQYLVRGSAQEPFNDVEVLQEILADQAETAPQHPV